MLRPVHIEAAIVLLLSLSVHGSPQVYSGSVRLEVTEAVLNHVSGSRGGIAGVYQRHDWALEKRALLDAWAAHVRSIVEGEIADFNVVTLARTA